MLWLISSFCSFFFIFFLLRLMFHANKRRWIELRWVFFTTVEPPHISDPFLKVPQWFVQVRRQIFCKYIYIFFLSEDIAAFQLSFLFSIVRSKFIREQHCYWICGQLSVFSSRPADGMWAANQLHLSLCKISWTALLNERIIISTLAFFFEPGTDRARYVSKKYKVQSANSSSVILWP